MRYITFGDVGFDLVLAPSPALSLQPPGVFLEQEKFAVHM